MSEQPRVWLLIAPRHELDELPHQFSAALFKQGAPPSMIVSLEGQGYTGQRAVLMEPDGFMRFARRVPFLFAEEFVRIFRILLGEDPFRIVFSFVAHRVEKETGIQITGHPVQSAVSREDCVTS